MRITPMRVLGTVALGAIGVWLVSHAHAAPHSTSTVAPVAAFTMAPVTRDYLTRNATIGFYERRTKADPSDYLSWNMLSGHYLQRYREIGDLGDAERAERAARQSLRANEGMNPNGIHALASALLTFHRFHKALTLLDRLAAQGRMDVDTTAQRAALEMEIGHYAMAQRLLERVPQSTYENATVDVVRARYAEVSGHLHEARMLLMRAQRQQDTLFEAPAQARAWYHERLGEMAFRAGDVNEAKQDERDALALFPRFSSALTALAHFALARHAYAEAYQAASQAAAIVPLPETLGYQADAAKGLGHLAEAQRIQDLIVTIDHISNLSHTSDRLIAMYYADHRIHLDDALRIARLDALERGEEIYAQDTLAWAAAQAGHWDEARTAMNLALREGTEDALLDYHAAIIDQHFAARVSMQHHLRKALARNPYFHPIYAEEARRLLKG